MLSVDTLVDTVLNVVWCKITAGVEPDHTDSGSMYPGQGASQLLHVWHIGSYSASD